MKNQLKNGWALVTGASSGIGRVYALELAKLGMNVVVVARRKEKLDELKSEIEKKYDQSVEIIQSDLSLRDEPKRVFEQATKDRDIQVVINNAGIGFYGPLKDYSIDQYQKTIDLNIDISNNEESAIDLKYVDDFRVLGIKLLYCKSPITNLNSEHDNNLLLICLKEKIYVNIKYIK